MTRLLFCRPLARWKSLGPAVLLLCALAGLYPHAAQAVPCRRHARSAAYPRGLVAVPGMALQLRRPSHQTPARRAAYLTVTVPTSGYADIGLYRQTDDRWVCVRSRVLRRTRSTITLSARPSARHPHGRYAVLAHRTEMRPKPALKPSHAHIRVPLVKMSPPMPDGR